MKFSITEYPNSKIMMVVRSHGTKSEYVFTREEWMSFRDQVNAPLDSEIDEMEPNHESYTEWMGKLSKATGMKVFDQGIEGSFKLKLVKDDEKDT